MFLEERWHSCFEQGFFFSFFLGHECWMCFEMVYLGQL